ncbi:MAG TPA: amidohydrolase family protein [Thermoleophilaceae bacterium]
MAGVLVDVHCHYLPASLAGFLRGRRAGARILASSGGELIDSGNGLVYPVFPPLIDLDLHRERMEARGVATTLLSIPPGPDALPAADAVAAARAANDELAELPAGLAGLAFLPLSSPADAEAELRRAARLGLAGGQLFSNIAGRPLDDEDFQPIFATAAELGIPLVLHPAMPMDGGATAGPELLTALGFVFETSACAARIAGTGVFERHPDLMLVLPHAGAALPVLMERLDLELAALGGGGRLEAPLSEQLRRLYVDAITPSPQALRLALDMFGVERVLYGTDEPFWTAGVCDTTLDRVDLAGEERELIESGNAERIFQLLQRRR